jgi:tetratricopeptide (TPR) repeat protein
VAHGNLGAALDDQGELDEAIAEYRSALALRPGDAMIHYNLSLALAARAKIEDSLAEYRRAVKLAPSFALPETNLDHAQRAKGDFEDAVAEYRHAPRSHSGDPTALANVGNAFDDEQPLAEAVPENPRVAPQVTANTSKAGRSQLVVSSVRSPETKNDR